MTESESGSTDARDDDLSLDADVGPPSNGASLPETCSVNAEGLCSQCGALLRLHSDGVGVCRHCGGLSVVVNPDADFPQGESEAALERFSLKKIVGEGAFGIVCKAWDHRLRRYVAIKMPKGKVTARHLLAREARAAAHLRHANIVRIFDVVETDDTVFIVSDFIDGPSMARYRLERKIDIPDACRLAITIARAMQYAHDQGVIHRDLKPSNIVMDQSGQPHILDFGLSRSRSVADGSLVRKGHPIGTPAFMSPEQAAGEGEKIGVTTDVYSFGIILFQLLANHLPFSGDSDEILHAVRFQTPPSIRSFRKDIPPALSSIIDKALAKEPASRYHSAGEFADELQAFLDGKPVGAYPKIDRRVIRRSLRIAALPALVAGLLISLVFIGRAFLVEQAKNRGELAIGIETLPNGAKTSWRRFDPIAGRLEDNLHEFNGGETGYLPPGFYKVIANADGLKAEVFRTVPGESDIRIYENGMAFPHRHWGGELNQLTAEPIELQVSNPSDEAVRIPGGRLVIGHDALVGPLHYDLDVEVGSFWITSRELGLAEVLGLFPEYSQSGIHYDIAAAYAERVGASLPTVEEYLYLDSREVELVGLRDGLDEWTESPQPGTRLFVDGKETMPGNLEKRLLLRSIDSGAYPEVYAAPLTHVRYFAPTTRNTVTPNAGFRLVWRE